MPQSIPILIVAAYASVRAGLHALLANAGDFALVAEARGSAELERLLPQFRPDVVVCDDQEEDRARVLAALSGGETGLVLLSDGEPAPPALRACVLPGWAVLRKEAEAGEIAAAVRAVAVGLVVFDPSLLPAFTPGRHAGLSQETGPGERLTGREGEVLQLLAQGLPNKQIAMRLGISTHTVKFHIAALLAKFGAASRTEAVTLGVRRGDVLL